MPRRLRNAVESTVKDVTTVRHHLETFHKPQYEEWAKKNNFESKLPKDVKARTQAAATADAKAKFHQQTLDSHLKEKPEKPAPYTDELFLDAACQWLIATDQVEFIPQYCLYISGSVLWANW
ncbi:hypothetical protein C8J57DRAFT_1629272 [Mycena rebaudengoi]|nr:hypothetical protein C8J57DRAFT_1629272 [Mycena rebaudengoi]